MWVLDEIPLVCYCIHCKHSYLIQSVFDWFTIFVFFSWIGNTTVVARWYNDHFGWGQNDFFIVFSDEGLRANLHSCHVRSLIQDMDIMIGMNPEIKEN